MSEDFNNGNAGAVPNNAANVPKFGINDIKLLLMIIDLAAKRGAFQPKEFNQIGEVYDRMDAFIAAAVAAENNLGKGG